ncbi:MAG: hypothetical protein WC878_04480 [Candidatus Paceibacterota bacterium]|jgi:hypothetical protein
MVKKIIEDITPLEKDDSSVKFRAVPDMEKQGNPVNISVQKNAYTKEMAHVEEALPKNFSIQEKTKEKVMEQSPIFEKMKQRHEERESFSQEYTSDKKKRLGRTFRMGAMIFGIAALIFACVYGFVFYSATVTIRLKHAEVALDNREFQAMQQSSDAIPFQSMTLSSEETVKLTPTGEKKVSKKASGKIVVYNSYNNQSQVLIKNTRFETPDGKIYRIDSQILVPGMKKIDGKDVPGSLEVTVYANEAGPEYNIGLVDFTIPGFKGSPRFAKFYARSKTPMTGGVNGLIKTISDDDREKAKNSLTATLKQKLIANAEAQKPKGSVLYENAMFFTFTDTVDDSVQSGEKDVPMTLKGSVDAILFDEAKLSRSIVQTSVSVGPDERIKIDNIEKLGFVWKTPIGSAPEKTDTLEFLLSGKASAVWEIDELSFKSKLAGVKKSEFSGVMVQFTGIEKATPKFNVFWRSSFPKNTEKIFIKTIVD